MMLWVVFAAMTALALAGLLRPLLRPAKATADRASYDLVVYGDQLDEISRDLERGLLSADQAEAARTEIQRRMLTTADATKVPVSEASARSSKGAALLITVLLPLFALGFYLMLGSPGLPDRPYSERAEQIAQMRERAATVQAMVDRLAERMKSNPDDGKGWMMLGRSYRALGRSNDAKDAYARAIRLMPKEVQPRLDLSMLLLDEADDTKTLPPEAVRLLSEVNAIDPNQPDALYFLGLDAAMKGDTPRARDRWNRLLGLLPPESPAREQVKQQLNGLK